MGTKFLYGFTENSPKYKQISPTDKAAQNILEKDLTGRFMAVLFLRNAKQSRFGDMLLIYQKAFANKEDRYPRTIPDMLDVMRQMPEKKWKPIQKSPEKEKEKEKETKASSFATKEKGSEQKKDGNRACYCCGDEDHLLPGCPDKKTKAKSDWHKPEYFKESYAQGVAAAETRSDSFEVSFFWGMQSHSIKKVEPEVILDSGSSIFLAKDKYLLKNVGKSNKYVNLMNDFDSNTLE